MADDDQPPQPYPLALIAYADRKKAEMEGELAELNRLAGADHRGWDRAKELIQLRTSTGSAFNEAVFGELDAIEDRVAQYRALAGPRSRPMADPAGDTTRSRLGVPRAPEGPPEVPALRQQINGRRPASTPPTVFDQDADLEDPEATQVWPHGMPVIPIPSPSNGSDPDVRA